MRRYIAAALLVAAAACDSMLTRPLLYNNVQVTVARRDGKPIPGATLLLYTGVRQIDIGTSDDNGRHLFERVPQGLYGVRAIPPAGFVPIENAIAGPVSDAVDALNLRSDSTIAVSLGFLEIGPGRVVVRLREPGGAPIRNALVALYDPKRVNATAMSDANGFVVFENSPFGLHGVSVTRPLFYRDFVRLQDSLYSVHDGFVSEKDRTDSLTFVLPRCSGSVDVQVVDDANTPVPGATVAYFTPSDALGTAVTNANGHTLREAPCANQIGIAMAPPLGYSASGRGSAFADGITVSNGATVPVTLRVHKTP